VAARQNFDALWERSRQRLARPGNAEFWQPDIFRLDHFHPQDSHWNAEGNRVFAEWVKASRIGPVL
jgi:hypothetical protein